MVATTRVAKDNASLTTTTEMMGSKTKEATTTKTMLVMNRRTAQTSLNHSRDATMTKDLTMVDILIIYISSRSMTVATMRAKVIKVTSLKLLATKTTGRATTIKVQSLSKIETLKTRTELITSMAFKVKLRLPMLYLVKLTINLWKKSSVDLLQSNHCRIR